MPEVYSGEPDSTLRRMLLSSGLTEQGMNSAFLGVDERGCSYFPQINSFYVRNFQMAYAAEEATRFLHHACRGLPEMGAAKKPSELFYVRTVEHVLASFGSRAFYQSGEAASAKEPMVTFEADAEVAGQMS